MCHAYAWRSPIAGVPSGDRCHGCHKFVDPEKPDIQLINHAFQDGKVIVWNRIYRVPDHVYFTHERHLAAGLRCQQCHGMVEQMDVIRQEYSLTMGWCLECHHQLNAAADCLTCHK
jgi:cytochrome c7-like protein